MTWKPRIVVFQCQYCLFTETDQKWMDTQLPENIKLIKVPCTGRISPLFVLNSIQGGADGIMISGCKPEACHFKPGNMIAGRQLKEFSLFVSYLGWEKERFQYVWLDISEQGRIKQEIAAFQETISALGPSKRLATSNIPTEGALR